MVGIVEALGDGVTRWRSATRGRERQLVLRPVRVLRGRAGPPVRGAVGARRHRSGRLRRGSHESGRSMRSGRRPGAGCGGFRRGRRVRDTRHGDPRRSSGLHGAGARSGPDGSAPRAAAHAQRRGGGDGRGAYALQARRRPRPRSRSRDRDPPRPRRGVRHPPRRAAVGVRQRRRRSGRAGLFEVATPLTRDGGTVLWYGVTTPDDRVAVSPYDVYRREITIRGSFAQVASFRQAVRALQHGQAADRRASRPTCSGWTDTAARSKRCAATARASRRSWTQRAGQRMCSATPTGRRQRGSRREALR